MQTNPTPLLWQKALQRRDYEAAEAIGVQLGGRNRRIRQGLARMLEEQGRSDVAARQWEELSASEPTDFEAAFHVASGKVRAGAAPVIAAAESGVCEAFAAHLTAALLAPLPVSPVRHIGVCGVSYCGSTVMNRVLGGLEGVGSIGESHRLGKSWEGDRLIGMQLTAPEPPPMEYCSVCGPSCSVLTFDFRRSLAADHTSWYPKIAARLGVSTLISSDKTLGHILALDPMLDFSALVLFKSPEQAWTSHRRNVDVDDKVEALDRYMAVWIDRYSALLDFHPTGNKHYLSFERFLTAPADNLRRLTEALSLPFDVAALTHPRPGHTIGGNARAVKQITDDAQRLSIRPLPPVELPAIELDRLAGWKQAQEIHAELLHLDDVTTGEQ